MYEEEVIGSDNMIWWSPSGRFFAFISLDDSNVENHSYETYVTPNFIYPSLKTIAFPKPGTPNPVPTISVFDTVKGVLLNGTFPAPVDILKNEGYIEDGYVLHHLEWLGESGDLGELIAFWQDRIQISSIPVRYQFDTGYFYHLVTPIDYEPKRDKKVKLFSRAESKNLP